MSNNDMCFIIFIGSLSFGRLSQEEKRNLYKLFTNLFLFELLPLFAFQHLFFPVLFVLDCSWLPTSFLLVEVIIVLAVVAVVVGPFSGRLPYLDPFYLLCVCLVRLFGRRLLFYPDHLDLCCLLYFLLRLACLGCLYSRSGFDLGSDLRFDLCSGRLYYRLAARLFGRQHIF